MAPHTGSCLCRAVKYELDGEPYSTVVCHCINCQKVTGCPYMSTTWYQKTNFRITQGKEHLKNYHDTDTKSGNPLDRSFCVECGSPVVVTTHNFPDAVIIAAGSLDEFKNFEPKTEYFPENRAAWVPQLAPPKDNGAIVEG